MYQNLHCLTYLLLLLPSLTLVIVPQECEYVDASGLCGGQGLDEDSQGAAGGGLSHRPHGQGQGRGTPGGLVGCNVNVK